jgi:23S rRNA G2445 N2-methylase RlmL
MLNCCRGTINNSVDQLVKLARSKRLLSGFPRRAPFRIMVTVDGQLTSLARDARSRLESTVAEQTGGRVNARGGTGVEYWVIARRDLSSVLLGLRLTTGQRKKPSPGSLSSDLARLLVSAGTFPEDVFLDPFCGSGSIVVARASGPFQRAVASDPHLRSLKRPTARAAHQVTKGFSSYQRTPAACRRSRTARWTAL